MMKRSIWKSAPLAALTVWSVLSGCSSDNFAKQTQTSTAAAGQYVTINPKLDLVIFQDDSDSMYNALNTVEPQLQNFVSSLSSSWDYRVVVMPLLSNNTPMSAKAVIATDCTTVTGVATCVNPNNISYFTSLAGNEGWNLIDNSATGNNDWGFANMNYNINDLIEANFFRTDSVKAFVVFSNGEDQSGLNPSNPSDWSYQADGVELGVNYNSADAINSFNAYENYFNGLKGTIGLNQFYSVVSAARNTNCDGEGLAWQGLRYMNMAQVVGGASFDICSGSGLSNVLNSIAGNLQTVEESVTFNFAVVSTDQGDEPDWGSVVIQENGVTIPQSSTNGWEPVSGYQTNHPTSNYPVVGNDQSGWMVQLYGSAVFSGSTQLSINYQNQ